MSFPVVWQRLAEDQLAALWASAPDQQAVADAADDIDDLLRRDPLAQGESRTGGVRILFRRPLSALFRVDEPAAVVYVMAIKRAKRPPGPSP